MLLSTLFCLSIGVLAGFIGTLLGIGGGSLTTPLLILFGVQPHQAIAASLIAIMGTSLGGIYHLFRLGLVNIGLAIFLETASILGAFLGAHFAIKLPAKAVTLAVAVALLASATLFIAVPVEEERRPLLGSTVSRIVAWLTSLVAGFLSATAGIGGGILKTPTLTLVVGLSLKNALATSKLMVGITAATGALVYGLAGHVEPTIAIPLAVGTYVGASIGARTLAALKPKHSKTIAVAAYTLLAAILVVKALT